MMLKANAVNGGSTTMVTISGHYVIMWFISLNNNSSKTHQKIETPLLGISWWPVPQNSCTHTWQQCGTEVRKKVIFWERTKNRVPYSYMHVISSCGDFGIHQTSGLCQNIHTRVHTQKLTKISSRFIQTSLRHKYQHTEVSATESPKKIQILARQESPIGKPRKTWSFFIE